VRSATVRGVLALALAAAVAGCYVDVMAGLHAPIGTTPAVLVEPAWSLGVAVGGMGDLANFTEGEVPFAFALGWGTNEITADGHASDGPPLEQDHFVGQWQLGVEAGLAQPRGTGVGFWWSLAGALAFSDAQVETKRDGMTNTRERGWGWSSSTGPVLRLGFSDVSFRVYFEGMLSQTSVAAGRTTFVGGQVRLRLHDWRVLIAGALFEALTPSPEAIERARRNVAGTVRRDPWRESPYNDQFFRDMQCIQSDHCRRVH
jgi:hypothetical protein